MGNPFLLERRYSKKPARFNALLVFLPSPCVVAPPGHQAHWPQGGPWTTISRVTRGGRSKAAKRFEHLASSCLLCNKPMTRRGGYALVSSRSIFEPAN